MPSNRLIRAAEGKALGAMLRSPRWRQMALDYLRAIVVKTDGNVQAMGRELGVSPRFAQRLAAEPGLVETIDRARASRDLREAFAEPQSRDTCPGCGAEHCASWISFQVNADSSVQVRCRNCTRWLHPVRAPGEAGGDGMVWALLDDWGHFLDREGGP